MQYLNRTQFNHVTRFSRIGLGKDDISEMVGIIRRLQEKEATVSGKVGDLTYTFWFVPTAHPGTVLRVCAMGLLAEQAQGFKVGDTLAISGTIVASTYPWVKASAFKLISLKPAGREEWTEEEQHY